jgi:hypothetical protein
VAARRSPGHEELGACPHQLGNHGKQPCLRLELEIELESNSLHKPAFLAVDVLDSAGWGLLQAIPKLEGYLMASEPRHLVKLGVDLPALIPGTYLVTVWAGSHNSETLDEAKEVVAFEVHDSPTPGRTFPIPRTMATLFHHQAFPSMVDVAVPCEG